MWRRDARVALWLAGVHALNVSFVSIAPGVERSDHLVTFAAVVLMLALVALAWDRGSDGLRGTAALLLAAPVVATGALAVVDVANRGLRGQDVTGIPMLAAGAILVLCGASALWRSRYRGRHPVARRVLKGAAAVVLAFEVAVPAVFAVVATQRPRDAQAALNLGAPARDVRLETADGLTLAASWVPARNGRTVVLFPRRAGTQRHARMLVRNGFGVLSVDMRGYGDSDGDPNAFGWGATRDVDAAVAFLRAHGEERIGALGLSVGGEQLLEAAAGNVNLRAVVSDGAGERSVKETADRGWAATLVLPQRAVMTTAIAALSGDTPPVGLGDAIDAISPRPVFLVYAEHGAGGEDLTPEWFDAAGRPKLSWRVPGAGHTGGLEAQPREYERRVVGFLKDRL